MMMSSSKRDNNKHQNRTGDHPGKSTKQDPATTLPQEPASLPSPKNEESYNEANKQQDSKDDGDNHSSRWHPGVCKVKDEIYISL